MNRRCLLLLSLLALPVRADELTLQKIMARDWIGTAPENPRFADDGRALYYEKRRPRSEIVDLYRVEIASGASQRIEDRDRGTVDPAEVVWSRDRRVKAFVRDGDLFYREVGRGALHQVTRTAEAESSPLVLLDGRIAFRSGDSFQAFDPKSGTVATLAELLLADDPDSEKPKSFLDRQQMRYFGVLRERKERRDDAKQAARARRAADPTRAPEPWFLGKGLALLDAALSPDGRHLAVVLGPERDASEDDEQGADGGKPDKMPLFVTESGYVEVRDVRPKVGTGKPETPRFALLELASHERHDLDFGALPGIHD
ncbi:MAG: TolB family protein, partial [Candidatus Binatia bacterium]